MQINEVKDRKIKEMRRHISSTGLVLSEGRTGFFFEKGRSSFRNRACILPEIESFMDSRQRRAWERLPQSGRERIIQKMQASDDYFRYETLVFQEAADRQKALQHEKQEKHYKAQMEKERATRYEQMRSAEAVYQNDSLQSKAAESQLEEKYIGKGVLYEETYRFKDISYKPGPVQKERTYLPAKLGSVRTDARTGVVPQVGERQRADAGRAIAPAETYTGISRYAPPEKMTRFQDISRAASAPVSAGKNIAEGAATGGISEAVRFGTRAVKKAAKAFGRSVSQKETAQKEASIKSRGNRSAVIGGDMASSSYAGGASRILTGAIAAVAAAGVMVLHVMLMPVLTIVLITVVLLTTLFSTISAVFTVAGAGGDASYLSWAVSIAEDDSHGYSQAARTGPDYDCSSFVWYALTEAGYELGSYPFATGAMPEILTAAGFEQLPYTGMEDLLPGDILWVHGDEAQHTEMYMGDGQVVGASNDLDGGLPGDQSGTGAEIRVGGFYDDGWMGVFRSTAYGMGDIAIPQTYEGYEVGTIYTCTPHYGTWSWVYNQARVRDAWVEAGSVYSENVAMIDDKYLIACTETFGRVGDWVTFYFENGEAVECIIADAKSPGDANWTPWGHIHGLQIDVIEAETNLTINPGTPGCMESWGRHRPVSATNHGAFI